MEPAVQTPRIDALAENGDVRDAHAAAATCTPSRFAMLTVPTHGEEKTQALLGAMRHSSSSQRPLPSPISLRKLPIKPLSLAISIWPWTFGRCQLERHRQTAELGFDYAFLIPATGDRVPCVYVENHRVVGLDTNDPIEVSFKKKVGKEPLNPDRPDLLTMHPAMAMTAPLFTESAESAT